MAFRWLQLGREAAKCLSSAQVLAALGSCSTSSSLPSAISQAGLPSLTSLSFSSGVAQNCSASEDAAEQPATYRVDVVTGDVRGAGTQAPATIQMFGAWGSSAEYVLGNDRDENGFERDSRRHYELEIDQDLGPLERILVAQVAASTSALGNDWFLREVEVTEPAGSSVLFPCNRWLGRDDAVGGDMQLVLLPAGRPEEVAGRHSGAASSVYLAEPLEVSASGVALPHPDKLAEGGPKAVNRKGGGWGGEDAYFCADSGRDLVGMGVADGVYMWKTRGVDSGKFSRALMDAACSAVRGGAADVRIVLRHAADSASELQGSSTVCIVLIDALKGQLTSANVGDSGYAVVGRQPYRSGLTIKYRSPQQEHSFGYPYQLGHHGSADRPEDAMLITLPVMAGDVVVLGTDGLWDNLSDERLLTEVRAGVSEFLGAAQLAHRLLNAAFGASTDRAGQTPYSLGASEAFDMVYSGGKMDDITVAVALLA